MQVFLKLNTYKKKVFMSTWMKKAYKKKQIMLVEQQSLREVKIFFSISPSNVHGYHGMLRWHICFLANDFNQVHKFDFWEMVKMNSLCW
jgi:hypothetical protein